MRDDSVSSMDESGCAGCARCLQLSVMTADATTTRDHTPWVPTDQSLPMRLAMVRAILGWNMREAALACRVTPTSWRDWEQHGRLPRDLVGTMRRVSERTGVDLVWLLTGTPDPSARRDSNPRPEDYKDHVSDAVIIPFRPRLVAA